MRDTLLLVLACIGGTSVMLAGVVIIWVGGNACVDWYGGILASRHRVAAIERADRKWGEYIVIANRHRPDFSLKEGFARYSSVDQLIAESSRRAGARGESDG